jgi:hypothetical protein
MGIILEGNFLDIEDSSDSLERNQKEEEYIDYIESHRERVKESYETYFLPLMNQELELNSCSNEEFQLAIHQAATNIAIHDESKYSDEEFTPYRIRFYPTEKEKVALENSEISALQDENFAEAWKHHYSNNPHHPKYWIDEKTGIIKDMELKYIIEMLCDWLSFGDDIRVWYMKHAEREKKEMSIRTKEIVEELMELIYNE